MPVNPTYSVGTVSVAAGATVVSGAGTMWVAQGVRTGDIFEGAGLTASILRVDSNSQLVLARGWPGSALTGSPYEIRFTPDATRVLSSARHVVELMEGQNLPALASLESAGNQLPYFNGPGTAALTPFSQLGRNIVGQTTTEGILNLLGITGNGEGTDGVGIASTSYNSNTGVLTLTYTNGATFSTSDLRGQDRSGGSTTPVAPFLAYNETPSETSYSGVSVTTDTVDQPARGGTKVNGFKAMHSFGGATTRGGRHAIYGILLQAEQTAIDNPDRNYVGAQGHVQTSIGDGGTAPNLANGRGAYFGGSCIAVALDGAVNILNLTGFESNSRARAGSSVAFLSGLQIVTKDEVQGAIFDCALAISRGQAGTTVGKRHGILFGNMSGGLPVADDGTVIGWTGGGTVQHGIDFSAIGSITGDLIRGGGARFNRAQVVLGTTTAAEIDASTASSMTYKAPVHAFNAQVRPTGDNAQLLGAAAQRWQAAYIVNMRPGTGAAIWTSGSGTPEGVVSAVVGSMFTRTDGAAGTTLYVKESGTGATGWVAK